MNCVSISCLSLSLSLSLSISLSLSFCLYMSLFPLSSPLSFLTARSYQPVDLDATRIAIIVVGVFFCGVCIIAITVLLIGILVYVVRRRVKRTGKHETLVEEEEYERRQRRREKRNKM